MPPSTGAKTSAYRRDPAKTANTVTGKYRMNWPVTPGQSIRGKNAASVVPTEAIIGQNMRLAAFKYAWLALSPAVIFRSANSTTTMAPSISIPSPSSIPNITMKL